jgi:hypothetical protein
LSLIAASVLVQPVGEEAEGRIEATDDRSENDNRSENDE